MEYNNTTNVNLDFFNLMKDGDTAIVRLMHSSVDKIERKPIHYVKFGGKTKVVKCLNNSECPCCLKSTGPLDAAVDRIFVHLFDYADNKEKVWNRTPTILSQFEEIQNAWGKLSDCVLKITRVGNDYPKYTIVPLNPMNYAPVDASRIDVDVAYRCFMTRSKEELEQFYATGVMPEHKKAEFVPKEQYNNSQQVDNASSGEQAFVPKQATTFNAQPISQTPTATPPWAVDSATPTTTSPNAQPTTYSNPFGNSDPFANFTPKRV